MSALDSASKALIQEFFDAYPAEAAEAFAGVPVPDGLQLLAEVTDTGAAAVVERLDPDHAVRIIEAMDSSLFRRLWSVMDASVGARTSGTAR